VLLLLVSDHGFNNYMLNVCPCILSQISLIRWAYEALCVNEFTGLALVPESKTGPLSVTNGEQVLENMGYAAGISTVKGEMFWYFQLCDYVTTAVIIVRIIFRYVTKEMINITTAHHVCNSHPYFM
jgi:hypothetical protein